MFCIYYLCSDYMLNQRTLSQIDLSQFLVTQHLQNLVPRAPSGCIFPTVALSLIHSPKAVYITKEILTHNNQL